MGAQHHQITAAPALGAALADGIYAGITTDRAGALYALVLLPTKPGRELPWAEAVAWARGLGEGADLPNRVEAALLFANLGEEFLRTWYWTNEEHVDDASSAWLCSFYFGLQSYDPKSAQGAVRAVLRLPLESFNPFTGPVERSAESVLALRACAQALLTACDAADVALATAKAEA